MTTILTLNAGSSNLKFSVFAADDADSLTLQCRDEVAGLGADALNRVLDRVDEVSNGNKIDIVGHRVVHGGDLYSQPVLIDARVLADLHALTPLAPLHQPQALAAIEALTCRDAALPQVACFDTAFHQTQPEVARRFGLPRALHDAGVKRYGFHGLSYEYIADVLPRVMGERAHGRVIVAHLGNGASLCGLRDGKSVATTMGFTPLDGLLMGTRCGALDPGAVLHLQRSGGMSVARVEQLLYHESGLLGVSGISADLRALLASSDPRAHEAVELFAYRIAREMGSMAAALSGVDALVFTAGIGENAPVIREKICRACEWLGVTIDAHANAAGAPRITADASPVSAWVIATREDEKIARHVLRTMSR